MERKKIIFFVPEWIVGGSHMIVEELLARFDKQKFDVSLYVSSPAIQKKTPEGIKVTVFEGKMRSSARAFAEFLKREKPDMVMAHIGGDISWILILRRALIGAQLFGKTKLMIVVHSAEDPSLRIKNWVKKIFNKCLQKAAKKDFGSTVDYCICVSEGLKNFVVNNYHIEKEKCEAIYNGINIESVQSKAGTEVPKEFSNINGFKAVMVARMVPTKDFSTLIKAIEILRDKNILVNGFFLGGGPIKDEVAERVKQSKYKDNMFVMGEIENPYPFVAFSDVFVLSSLSEGTPIVLLEALALGTPVIATDCPNGGVREFVENKKYGTLVPMRDAQKLAQAMEAVLNNKLSKQKAKQESDNAISLINIEVIKESYEKTVLKVLQ